MTPLAQLTILSFMLILVKGIVWPCERNESCSALDSFCFVEQGKCSCEVGKKFSFDFEKCVPTVLYGDKCEDSNQCNLMPSGAICKEGVCQCQPGFSYVRGKCRKLSFINQPCKDNIDCYFGYDRFSVICKTNKCLCANGYYERATNNCRRKSMALNDTCVVDTDCDDIKNGNGAICENFKCILPSNINRRESKEIAIQTNIDEIQSNVTNERLSPNSSSSSIGESRTSASLASLTLKSNSLKKTDDGDSNKYGGFCERNGQQCQGLHHSVCVSNICYCNLGYYHKNGICMAELGEMAATQKNCEFEYNQETKICQCVQNYFYEANLRKCKKPIHFKLSCTSDSQCSPFGVAVCSTVIPRRCECKDIAVFNETKQICQYREGLHAPCERNETCTIQNSYCSNNGKCVCFKKYVEKEGNCVKGIGAECMNDNECTIDSSECKIRIIKNDMKTCQCKEGYVHFKNNCFSEASQMNEDCVIDEQCKPLLATCTNNTCQCMENQHVNLNRCEKQKGIGEECFKAGECYKPENPDSIECRNSICQCKIGYKSENNQCKIKSKKNSSGRPSALKVLTFILIGSAFAITMAALKQAFY